MISVHFQDKPFNIIVVQVYDLTSNVEETEVEWFYEDADRNVLVPSGKLKEVLSS